MYLIVHFHVYFIVVTDTLELFLLPCFVLPFFPLPFLLSDRSIFQYHSLLHLWLVDTNMTLSDLLYSCLYVITSPWFSTNEQSTAEVMYATSKNKLYVWPLFGSALSFCVCVCVWWGNAHFGECSCHVMRQPCGEKQGNTFESRSEGS